MSFFLWDARLVFMWNWDYFCEKDKKTCCYHSSILKLQSEGYPCNVIDIPVQVEADITEDKQNASSLYSSLKSHIDDCFTWPPVSDWVFDLLDHSIGLLRQFYTPWT